MNLKHSILILFLFVLTGFSSIAQKQEILLNTNWKAKRANEVPVDGTVVSSSDFELYDWMDAVVPGTALTTLLHNNKVPDPFFGMNNELIPDIYETGAAYYTFWFQNNFILPQLKPNHQAWLKFRGINYSANIFLNGKRVNTDTHRGMFLREKYLITPLLNNSESNNLAVLVEPPNPVGNANGGQGGDGTIARSVTMQYTAGWDWICPIRDRNTGIWDQVAIEITGPVDVRDTYIKTRVPGKRIPGDKQDPAFISMSAELVNATKENQDGTLIAKISDKEWRVPATVKAGGSVKVEFPEIKFENPKLWWPNGMGAPELYQLEVRFEQNGGISDAEKVQFGIRQTSNYFDKIVGARVFLINGQKVFIKGGNWIASDAMLRLSPERYNAEVKMHAQMNMNMIRVWGGAMPERPEFYDACDRYGLLVWQDLWVSGDCNGEWPDPRKKESQERRKAYPDDHSLFLSTAIDQIKMLRNHASLYLWCGGNETPPAADIDLALRTKIFPEFDGTRYYVNESTSDSILRNTIGGNGDGPYGIQNPLRFFVTQSYPFNPELGSVGVPNVEAMRKMMEEKDLRPPVNDRANRVWQYHKYLGYGDHISRFGEIKGIDDFCKKAQVVNYEQYRALQEGFNAGMWNLYSGMLVWKNQNPWTALRGQFYDVFLDQNGGFYGFQHGAVPLHVQLNLNDSSVSVVNQTFFDANNLTVEAQLFDLHGNKIGHEQFQLDVATNTKEIAGKLFSGSKPAGLYFARLILKNKTGNVIDENLYWLTNLPSDMQDLDKLEPVQLQLQIDIKKSGHPIAIIKNDSNETAFFTRLKVVEKESGELQLPVFFSDNYLTLFPGEEKRIQIDLSDLPSKKSNPGVQLVLETFNGTIVKHDL
ncbi:MAG TPA: glycoside hydrolase family 2 TIM barrel-domain containing protein [Draconibacterium sp.]|nr:glycoside hydrolase family 2 TIM barrel-domain containing protein [Draconibacterium sp.]